MKFKCKQTGEVYSFPEWETESMKQHPDYEMVNEVEEEAPIKRVGRPAKQKDE